MTLKTGSFVCHRKYFSYLTLNYLWRGYFLWKEFSSRLWNCFSGTTWKLSMSFYMLLPSVSCNISNANFGERKKKLHTVFSIYITWNVHSYKYYTWIACIQSCQNTNWWHVCSNLVFYHYLDIVENGISLIEIWPLLEMLILHVHISTVWHIHMFKLIRDAVIFSCNLLLFSTDLDFVEFSHIHCAIHYKAYQPVLLNLFLCSHVLYSSGELIHLQGGQFYYFLPALSTFVYS